MLMGLTNRRKNVNLVGLKGVGEIVNLTTKKK